MTKRLEFHVEGNPVSQGSINVYNGRAVAVKAPLRKWRDAIRRESLAAAGPEHEVWDCPAAITVTFHMPAPANPRWPVPATSLDIDKCLRAVFDALTHTKKQAGIIKNDSRFIEVHTYQVYGTPGATITLREVAP